jgi:DNA-binding NtrC family response regulator
MLEKLRESIKKRLNEKGVSLIMMFDREGRILWHSGRKIKGYRIKDGKGFSKTACIRAIESGEIVEYKDDIIRLSGSGLSRTAISINIKSILIVPIDKGSFFYVDSIGKEFSVEDVVSIKESCFYLKECIRESERYGKKRLSSIKTLNEDIKEKIIRYGAESETPILLTGETGVGKGYVSKIIHEVSGREGKYVNLNIVALSEGIFESELFGYKKGAFTDAREDKRGLIEEAEGGTLFLDEIADLSYSSQTKILKVIEEKTYIGLGDTKERKCDVRFVFATGKDIMELVKEKKLRSDLYYRISEFWIDIPPLRERRYIMEDLIKEYKYLLKGKEFSKEAKDFIIKYSWKGNIREFKSMLKKAGTILNSEEIGVKDIVESVENHLNIMEIIKIIKDMGIEDKCAKVYERIKKSYFAEKKEETVNKKREEIIKEIERGRSFWEVVKKPFMNRDLNRQEVKQVIEEALKKTESKRYKECLKYLKIREKEHKKFLDFIKDYNII